MSYYEIDISVSLLIIIFVSGALGYALGYRYGFHDSQELEKELRGDDV